MIINFLSALTFLLSLQYALYAQINQGIVTTLYSFTSIVMALIGRIVFKEAIRVHHLIGLILLIACASIISLSGDKGNEDIVIMGKVEHRISPIYAVLMALLCPFTFAAQNFIVRVVDMSHSYNAIDFRIASQFMLNGILIIISIFVIPGRGLGADMWIRGGIASFI